MKSVQNGAAYLFITAVAILSIVSILGVWDVFEDDVISKSFQTLGILAVVAAIVMVAGKFIESRSQLPGGMPALPSPGFKSIRSVTLIILIVSVSILALLGVMSIWEVITDRDILYKSLGSLAILAFSAFVIVITCLNREDSPLLKKTGGSAGPAIAIIFILYLLFMFARMFN